MGREGHSWPKSGLFISLGGVHGGAPSGAGGQPEQEGGAVPALPRGLAGLDTPIETKLHPPGVRGEWVERTRLIDELAHTTAKLVLVDAPAGFGKTTLVAQWRSSPAEKDGPSPRTTSTRTVPGSALTAAEMLVQVSGF